MPRSDFMKRLGLVGGAVLTGIISVAFLYVYWRDFFLPEETPAEARIMVIGWTTFVLILAILAKLAAERWRQTSALLGGVLCVGLVALLALPTQGYEVFFRRVFIASFIPPILLGLCLGALRRIAKAAPSSPV